MTTADKDPKPKPLSREQKLAQALRANLRRRKAGERTGDQDSDVGKSGEKD